MSIDWKFGPEELPWRIKKCIPEFTYSYENDPDYKSNEYTSPDYPGDMPTIKKCNDLYYIYKGTMCNESIDHNATIEQFIPDVVNPIIEKKFRKQFLFSFPGSDSYEYVLVDSEHSEKAKANTCFDGGTYDQIEKFYGYSSSK